ncbi:MAG: hypothetical protein DME22_17195 [Verrucomicrobia bacterium]|nr:MAG: hypothetical protein DME22_17195 [Verrucomicrobiota bacterium]
MNSGVSVQSINQGEMSHPQSAQIRAAQLITERNGDLPIWIRAPTRGREYYHLQSILQFIERCERAAQNPQRSLDSEERQRTCTPPRSAEQFR